jgi:hypothetical protein
MKNRPFLARSTVVFGGTAAWGLLLVFCVMVNRTVLMPPIVPGATFIGAQDCAPDRHVEVWVRG